MSWNAGADVTTGDLITAAQWNNYLGVSGSLEFLHDKPMARVYHNASQAATQEAFTTLAFNSERFDNDVIHDVSTNNSRLTCKTAGKYLIIANVYWSAVQPTAEGTTFLRTSLKLNGTTYIASVRHLPPTESSNWGQIVTTLYQLAVNDYIEVLVYPFWVNANAQIDAVGNYSPEFMMCWIGA